MYSPGIIDKLQAWADQQLRSSLLEVLEGCEGETTIGRVETFPAGWNPLPRVSREELPTDAGGGIEIFTIAFDIPPVPSPDDSPNPIAEEVKE